MNFSMKIPRTLKIVSSTNLFSKNFYKIYETKLKNCIPEALDAASPIFSEIIKNKHKPKQDTTAASQIC